jgi:hypothetical protein
VPATLRDVDRELVDLLSDDPDWVRRRFDAIVATEFPPDPPPAVVPAPSAAPDPPPARCRWCGRGPSPATGRTPGATGGHRQRSPPGRPVRTAG